MKNLEKVISEIEAELEEKDQVREVALKSSRVIVRLSGTILRGLHSGQKGTAELAELKDELSRLSSLLKNNPDIAFTGYVETAFQEYSEVSIVLSILEKDDVPSPEDLDVSSTGYLLGLGDSVGELRRFCLDELKAGKTERANYFLERMEDIFVALIRFDLPDAIVPIRRKQDVARSLLEKTRGDVAVATSARNLQDKLEEVLRKS
jgi:translin